MKPSSLLPATILLATLAACVTHRTAPQHAELRIGLIGLDTSHVMAFTKCLNDEKAKDHIAGAKVVAGFKGGSKDIESSWSRIDKHAEELQKDFGVKLYDSIEEMCKNVDAVMLESVDGRPHLEQAKPVIAAGKILFIDKPMAGSLKDALEIFRLAKKKHVPVFSSSSLRFGKTTQAVRNGLGIDVPTKKKLPDGKIETTTTHIPAIGKVLSAQTSSPASLEPHHIDLFWYGIHGVESLFTVMGTGCESVKRGTTADGKIEVVGTWAGGRTGTFTESKSYGGTAKGEKGEASIGSYDGYAVLVEQVVKFFQTRVVPVPERETIEILAFMEAADESKRQGGAVVSVKEILKKNGI